MTADFISVPDGWEVRPLIECTSDGVVSYGIVQPGAHDEEGVPIVRVNNFDNNTLDTSSVLRVSHEVEAKYARTRLEGGEVLLTLVGSTGQSVVVPRSLAGWNVPRAIAVIRPADDVGAEWINICLQSSATAQYLDSRANTTVQKTLNLKDVKQIPVLLPPKEIKDFIESVAGSLNSKIELNRQINATLESMAQALFKSWFVDFDPVIDNALAAGNPIPEPLQARAEKRAALLAAASAADIRSASATDNAHPTQTAPHTLPGTTAPATPLQPLPADLRALFPDSFVFNEEMGWVPEGWIVEPIGNLIDRLPVGKKFSQKTASEIGQVPILDQGKSGVIGFHSEAPGVEASPDAPVIVFANHTCYMRLIMHDFSAIQNVLPFKGRELDIYWLYYATLGKQSFIEYKGHWPDFVLHKLVVPNGDLDAAFGERASNFAKAIFARETQNETLSGLRDALLPKLLSGQIELPEVEQLVAEVL